MKKYVFLIALPVVIILDQLTKWLATKYLMGKSIWLGFFALTYITNAGGAFGIFPKFALYFTIVGCIVVLGFFLFLNKIMRLTFGEQLLLGMIAGGAIGNLIDRLRLGFRVVDFIDFKIWPVFNLADSCITIGVCGLVLLELLRARKEK